MEDINRNLRKINNILLILFLLNVIFFLVAGDFQISIFKIGFGRGPFVIYLVIWLITLTYLIYTHIKIRSVKIVKFWLLPISIITLLLFAIIIFSSGISGQEGSWFCTIYYLIVLPFHLNLTLKNSYNKSARLFNRTVLICTIGSSAYIYLYYFDFFKIASFYDALIIFLFVPIILSLLIINISLLIIVLICKLSTLKRIEN